MKCVHTLARCLKKQWEEDSATGLTSGGGGGPSFNHNRQVLRLR
jgi:hypothetical protein